MQLVILGALATRLGVGVGAGWLTAHDDIEGSRGTMTTASYAREVTGGLDVLFETIMLAGANYSPEPTKSQEIAGLLVGIRWAPIRIATTTGGWWEPRDLFVQGNIGVNTLTISPYNELFASASKDNSSIGLTAGGALGWYPFRFGNARFGLELIDQIAWYRYGNDFGRRQHIAVTTGVEIQL